MFAARTLRMFIVAAVLLLLPATPGLAAQLTVSIDISQQRMAVMSGNRRLYVWPVSTARPGYRTPRGVFHPYRLERTWYSTIYDYAPMPHSIFFLRGYAIHGTTDIRHLGRPVSHGCVRLHPDNARILFDLVRKAGMAASTIVVKP